jgi:hypothetical protein
MKKRTATQAYNEHIEQARQHLKRITEGLGAHIAKASTSPAGSYDRLPNWGDVGDLAHLNELLEEAARFIHNEGE